MLHTKIVPLFHTLTLMGYRGCGNYIKVFRAENPELMFLWQAWISYLVFRLANVDELPGVSCGKRGAVTWRISGKRGGVTWWISGKRGGVTWRFVLQAWGCYLAFRLTSVEVLPGESLANVEMIPGVSSGKR